MDKESVKKELDELVGTLKRERDELRVQLELAKLEARDEWEELEDKWEDLESRLDRAGEQAKESLADVGAAAGVLVDEIKAGYRRIRDSLGD